MTYSIFDTTGNLVEAFTERGAALADTASEREGVDVGSGIRGLIGRAIGGDHAPMLSRARGCRKQKNAGSSVSGIRSAHCRIAEEASPMRRVSGFSTACRAAHPQYGRFGFDKLARGRGTGAARAPR